MLNSAVLSLPGQDLTLRICDEVGLKSYANRLQGMGVTLLLTLLAIASFATSANAQAAGEKFEGYIDSTALNVRADAGTQSEVVSILLKYDPVSVVGQRKVDSTTWYSIEAAGGYTSGWVAARFVKRGAPPANSTGPVNVDYGAKSTPTLVSGPFQYIGARACKECHEDSVSDFPDGASVVWQEHFHSAAYQTLKRDYTKEISRRARGVEDPANDWRCVKCHVTAFGAPPSQIASSYDQEEGVGCEVCHGPGGSYAQEDHGPSVPNREAMGFRVLRNLDERREVCTSCHNTASPTFKGFDLRQFSRKIAHWVDDDDDQYRAEAGRESNRRSKSIAGAASATAGTAATAAATAAASAESEAASRAAQSGAEARAKAAADLRAKEDAAKAESMRQSETAGKQAEAERQAAANRQAEAKKQAEAEASKAKRAEEAAAAAAATAAAAAAAKANVAPPAPATPPPSVNELAHFLDDVKDVIVLNKEGEKYGSVKFPHRKHAGNEYLPNGDCQTCHHTQEGNDSPEACSSCHDIGGDAEETSAKKRFAHEKKKTFPKKGDQEEVSCVGCHKSMNTMLEAGKREGDEAPIKCTTCHKRKS